MPAKIKKKDITVGQRMKRYRDTRKAEGWIEVRVWVPTRNDAKELQKRAKEMREHDQEAVDLNAACIDAINECPQHNAWGDSTELLYNGKSVVVEQLGKAGMKAVIAYWSTPRTLGGSLLIESGYADYLTDEQCKRLGIGKED